MNKQSAYEILTSGAISQDVCLNSVFEIDQVLLRIIELNEHREHLVGLKKYRVDSANVAIKDVEDKIDQIRNLIHRTMVELSPGEKMLQFPSIGKVSRRKTPDAWSIDDEDALIKFLDSKGLKSAAIRVKEYLDAKSAKKIIEDLSSQGETVPGVTKQIGGESISITFEDTPKLAKITTVLPKDKAQSKSSLISEVEANIDNVLSKAKVRSKSSSKQSLNELNDLDV